MWKREGRGGEGRGGEGMMFICQVSEHASLFRSADRRLFHEPQLLSIAQPPLL